jgi:hypothetical protein
MVVSTRRGFSVHDFDHYWKDTDMDISLENETLNIYRKEIEALLQREEKYRTLGPAELEAIVNAFEFTLKNGREKVRAQMLYDLIHEKRGN